MAAWRYVLAHAQGLAPIADITTAARGKSKKYRLNRPAQLSFRIPSDDPGCATVQGDGLPAITPLRRVVLAYRRESLAWALRFGGHVWPVGDTGDEDMAWTTVTCFDPLQRMSKRQARVHDGPNAGQLGRVTFSDQDGALIARQLVDDTNFYAGESGLTTAGGTFETVGNVTVVWERRQVADALVDLSSQAVNGFDLRVDPVLLGSSFGRLGIFGRLGSIDPVATFGWGVAPFNARRMQNTEDPVTIANRVTSLGSSASGTQITSTRDDPASLDDLGAWEDVAYFNDVVNQTMLDDLTQAEVDLRKVPRKALKVVLLSGATDAEPFIDFDLGDVVTVRASTRLRGGFDEERRVFGIDVDVSDEGVESVEQVYLEEEA